MLSCGSSQEAHSRALKRVKVDSPVVTHNGEDGVDDDSITVPFTQSGKGQCNSTAVSRHGSLTPPPSSQCVPTAAKASTFKTTSDSDGEHDQITAEDVSPADTAPSSKSPSHEQHPHHHQDLPSAHVEGTVADDDGNDEDSNSSESRKRGHAEAMEVQDEATVLAASPHMTSPTRPASPHWRASARLTGATTTAPMAAASHTALPPPPPSLSSMPLPVSTNGAITTLRSLSQLAILVSSANTTSAKEKTHPDLRLKPGESVMLLLYFDEASLRPLINSATSDLSQMRVFTLNLAKLPPQDYEPTFGKRLSLGGGGLVVHVASPAHSSAAGTVDSATAYAATGSTAAPPTTTSPTAGATATHSTAFTTTTTATNAATGLTHASQLDIEEEEEEEEVLVPAVHPMAVSAAVAEARASAERERAPRTSAATTTTAATTAHNNSTSIPTLSGSANALALDEAASVSSLSGDLHHASEVISEKLRQLLAVDTILNPHATGSSSSSGEGSGGGGKREALLFPAMIVWRAAGAPREEYPPAPPQTYSSQPSPTPAELFCDRMCTQGGPLVVKEATSIDQVHSLTLFRPVYTMENLFRTLVRNVAPSYAKRSPGDKSRTVLYLGASWCPPCMRFVHEMPQFMREDLPSSVVCTVKADMDLAKPIYDYFKVEIIPTFVVLDNEVLMKCYDTLQQHGLAESSPPSGAASQSEYLRSIQDAFSRAELARLQNSNRQLVSTFVSKHSQTLSFDEDF